MTSYRFKRRSFLAAVGGAVGLHAMLRNLEAAAQGASSPPRLLLMHWPNGTVHYHFLPIGAGSTYTTSRILQPFEEAGLRDDMIVLYGLRHPFQAGGGGGPEAGVVFATTGADCPGTRENGGEGDDAVAGGPSMDQIFLKNVPELASPGGYQNVICDARVDSQETSARCLSYGYATQQIQSVRPGGMITEHVPLLPQTSPLELYSALFSGFMPGGGNANDAIRALMLRKSVLDSALRELDRLKTLAPSSERPKIDIHTETIRKLEIQISDQIADGGPHCATPPAPDASLVAQSGSTFSYADPMAEVDDSPGLELLGKLNLGIIRAAFQCDLLRVATFQWTSARPRASFKGLYPADPENAYMLGPMSSRVTQARDFREAPPTSETDRAIVEFVANVHTWFNQKTADVLLEFKNATDVFGGSLLEHTIVPFFTDESDPTDARSPLPALIFGGRALGMHDGQFMHFASSPRSTNDMWLTIAQAFFPDSTNVVETLAAETFVQQGRFTGPIEGLWAKP